MEPCQVQVNNIYNALPRKYTLPIVLWGETLPYESDKWINKMDDISRNTKSRNQFLVEIDSTGTVVVMLLIWQSNPFPLRCLRIKLQIFMLIKNLSWSIYSNEKNNILFVDCGRINSVACKRQMVCTDWGISWLTITGNVYKPTVSSEIFHWITWPTSLMNHYSSSKHR